MALGSAARAQVHIHGQVVDQAGRAVAGASVEVRGTRTVADASGKFALEAPDGGASLLLHASSGTMDSGDISLTTQTVADELRVVLRPFSLSQQATVTATRSSVAMGPLAITESTLTGEALTKYPALTLDESLRQHAGFELFRRSAGWVQNPTSQGISLRGLGSTAVSRSLVLANSAPLNDPFGGWIHWNEFAPGTIDAVTITSGGGSDLYGSSALGGVIDVVPARPGSGPRADVSVAGASEDTTSASARGDLQQGRWSELVAGQDFRTAGYILTNPISRGPVDVPANVHFQNGRVEADRLIGTAGRAFVIGNVLNEARGNGTLATTNGTRLWRYLAGDDWSAGKRTNGRVRMFGSEETYRQTFSSINATRTVESLTRVQHTGTQELGASTDASYHRSHVAFVAGADVRDIRGLDVETPITAGKVTSTQEITSRQRFIGGFGEATGELGRWSGAASLRLDSASNLDAQFFASNAKPTADPNRREIVLSPRIGLVRQLSRQVTVHGSGFRAFRTPTMNELYRNGQVGQELTLANAALSSERGTGAEGGITVAVGRVNWFGSYFWTEINRPVSAVLVSSTATTITNIRENLGQIQSQGLETGVEINVGNGLSATGGYQYAHAVVTKFSTQPSLIGNWIPDVARNSATAQLRYRNERLGYWTLAARNSGHAFDDSSNIFVLHSFFQLDAYGERRVGKGFTAFVSLQNLMDRRADVARTPILTLGIPFIAQGGIRYGWGGHRDM